MCSSCNAETREPLVAMQPCKCLLQHLFDSRASQVANQPRNWHHHVKPVSVFLTDSLPVLNNTISSVRAGIQISCDRIAGQGMLMCWSGLGF